MMDLRSKSEKTVRKWNWRGIGQGAVVLVLCLIAGGGAVASGRILQERLSPPTRTPTQTAESSPVVIPTVPSPQTNTPTVQLPTARPSSTKANTPTSTTNPNAARQKISPDTMEDLVELKKLTDSDGATDLAFTPDGKGLLTDGLTGVHLYGLPDLADVNLRPTQSLVRTVAVAPKGNRAAYSFDDGSIRLWNLSTGGDGPYTIKHKEPVYGLAFSPDGKLLASASRDGTIHVWESETMNKLVEMKGHVETAWAVAFSPDGKKLASASSDGTVRIWDPESGKALKVLSGLSNALYTVAFSPDGTLLAAGSHNEIILWETATWNQAKSLTGETRDGDIFSLGFSPDGRLLVSGSGDGLVRLFGIEEGGELSLLAAYDDPVNSVAFSPTGELIACTVGDNTVRLWGVKV